MFSKLSVRARIIVLGVIPVIGFLAIGLAYMTGDIEVGRAFDSVHRDSAVADASRDLKTGLLMMRAATTEFVARPSDQQVQDFADGQELAMHIARPHRGVLDASEQDVITPLRITVRDLKTSFESLVNEQKSLGYTEPKASTPSSSPPATRSRRSSTTICRGSPTSTPRKLLMSLLTMRRYEIEYRLTRGAHRREALSRRGQEFQRAVRIRSTARRR